MAPLGGVTPGSGQHCSLGMGWPHLLVGGAHVCIILTTAQAGAGATKKAEVKSVARGLVHVGAVSLLIPWRTCPGAQTCTCTWVPSENWVARHTWQLSLYTKLLGSG